MAAVSFKFCKTSKPSLLNSDHNDELKEKPDIVFSFEENSIKSSKPAVVKKDLVIPLIRKNNWRYEKNQDEGKSNETDLDKQAAAEIIEEAAKCDGNWAKNGEPNESEIQIPLMMSNMVPEGYETDDKLNVVLRPEVSSLEDYENVPIEQFGKAILRGMGWKLGEGIGASNKQVVKPIEAVLRPKGLGLGADPKLVEKIMNPELRKDNGEADFTCGGYVKVIHGPHRDLYGQIESIDEETGRVFVRLSLSKRVLSLSKFILTVASKKEYKESKILNKSKYEEHAKKKDEELQKTKEEKKSKSHFEKNDQKKRYVEEERNGSLHTKKKKHGSSRSSDGTIEPIKQEPWIRPYLRVRFIDKKYHHGKYFNSKVIIEDVVSPYTCVCQTGSSKLLEGIDQDQLETVVPKHENANVMVVGTSKYCGRIAQIVKRSKSSCKATVKFYEDELIARFHFDEICEFVGELPEYV